MIKYIIYWTSYLSNYDTLDIAGRIIISEKDFTYYTREGYKTLPIRFRTTYEAEGIYILDNGNEIVTIHLGFKKIKYSIKDEHITLRRNKGKVWNGTL